MHPFPERPSLSAASPETIESGHLWLLELVDGGPLRFRVQPSGLIAFGDAEREYQASESLPPPYRYAVRHVRQQLDRDALREAVDDVTSVTFYGRATFRRAIDYDWERLPPFLGYDVWTGDRWVPPDAAEQVFSELNLSPAHTIEREYRARDFTPPTDEFPRSAYYEGPVAGVIVHNKGGGRACARNEAVLDGSPPADQPADLETFVAAFTRPDRVQRLQPGQPASGGTTQLLDLVLEAIYREAPHVLDGSHGFDESALRRELARQLGSGGEASSSND